MPESSVHSRSRTALAAPVVRVALAFGCLLTLFALWGKTHFYADPGSFFFDPDHAYERLYSAVRQTEADNFIAAAQRGDVSTLRAGTDYTICAVIVTVNRETEKQYVETAIGSILGGLTPEERRDIRLKILFADTVPESHPTWKKDWLRKIVDDVIGYTDIADSGDKQHLADLEREDRHQEKAIIDYSTALRVCNAESDGHKARYVAVFEDDIVVAEGWLARTLIGLQEVEARTIAQNKLGNWLYLRLFTQERSTGWGSKSIGGNNEFFITLLVAPALLLSLLALRRRVRSLRNHLDNASVAFICLVSLPVTIIAFFQAGKASLLAPSSGVSEGYFGCCSQGLVFNAEHTVELAAYLRWRAVGQYDMMTRDFSWGKGLSEWTLYPIQLQHIGLRSAGNSTKKEAQSVFSMLFERLDKGTLQREHEAMVARLYGEGAHAHNG